MLYPLYVNDLQRSSSRFRVCWGAVPCCPWQIKRTLCRQGQQVLTCGSARYTLLALLAISILLINCLPFSFVFYNRFLYERAVVLSDYGTMLTKWDKRELSGSDMIRDADIIFDTIPTSGKEKMPFTSMFLLPIELWFTSHNMLYKILYHIT